MSTPKRGRIGDPDRLFAISITRVGEFSRVPPEVQSLLRRTESPECRNMLRVIARERASGDSGRVQAASNLLEAYCEVVTDQLVQRLRR